MQLRLEIAGPEGSYADGSEDRVLQVLRGATDRRTGSDELAAHISDWPTRYHLSGQRANLLRPFTIGPGVRVLDVGAGTGALTRYLGETGAEVTAVEPSLARATAAAMRCADLGNVRVLAGSLDALDDEEGFHVVVAVGVLEYSAADDSQAYQLLDQLSRHLKPDGVLILAIENQLGLRYLLGYREDHLDEPWAGVEDYAGQRRVRTFGRSTLMHMLAGAGLAAQRWLFPYPDYKMPTTIVDALAFDDTRAEGLVDALVRWPCSDAASAAMRLCDERRAHRVFLREHLGRDVANSFLVVAARQHDALTRVLPSSFVALHMSGDRRGRWQGSRRVVADNGRLVMAADAGLAPESQDWLTRVVGERRPFVHGPTIEQLALDACASDPGSLALVLGEWRQYLRRLERPQSAVPAGTGPYSQGGRTVLPASYLDLVLSNFVRDTNGRLHYVDDEWRSDGPVNADLVCARALFWFAHDLVVHGARHPFGPSATVMQITDALAALCGVDIGPWDRLLTSEAAFQSLVTGRPEADMATALHSLADSSQLTLPTAPALPVTALRVASTQVARLEQEAATAREETAAAREDAAAAREEADTARQEAATVQAEVAAARQEAVSARNEAAAAKDTIRELRHRRTEIDTTLAIARVRVHELEAELAQERLVLSNERATHAAVHDADAARVRQLLDAVTRLGTQLKDDGRRYDDLRAELRAAHAKLAATSGELEDARRASERAFDTHELVRSRLQAELRKREAEERSVRRHQTDIWTRDRSRLVQFAARLFDQLQKVRVAQQLTTAPGGRRAVLKLATSRRARTEAWAQGCRVLASGLFDAEWYAAQTGLALTSPALAMHYALTGHVPGPSPTPLFDPGYYLSSNTDVAATGVNPLLHYLDHGAREGRKPHALFDSARYIHEHPDVAARNENPLVHFLREGGLAGARPCAHFDSAWYLETYPDVAAAGVNPLLHYLSFGAAEGRNPNPFFDTAFYLEQNADVLATGINPLVHYVLHGWKEGRPASYRFDSRTYLAARPDVAATGMDPLEHMLLHGVREHGHDIAGIPSEARPAVFLHLNTPTGPTRAKLTEVLRLSGYLRAEAGPLAAIVVYTVGAASGHQELALDTTTARGAPQYFEANLRLTTPGELRVMIAARYRDGRTVDVASLPPVTVVDDEFCGAMARHVPTTRRFSVLYVDGVGREFQSPRYRIDHMREALATAGVSSSATTVGDLHDDISLLRRYDILVLFRTGWDWRLQGIVDRARAWNIPVVFDVDDYVFEPSIATPDIVSGISRWTPQQVEAYRDGVRMYRQTLEACDYFTGATPFLVERARELDKPAFLLNNHLGTRMVALGDQARAVPLRDGSVDITYFSGSRTHQRDFATVVPALADVLASRPQTRLLVFGYLDLDEFPELQPHAERIVRFGFAQWDQVPLRAAGSHITIAPLEVGNPFCEAKSELKYFEGAVAGMAVVAAATGTFSGAIRDGETGFLCRTTEEWRDRLLTLVDDPDLRARLAAAGAAHAIEQYGPAHAAAQAVSVYRDIIADTRRRLGVAERSLVINWATVDPFAGSGGHNDIFIAANEMVRRGHHVTLFFSQDEREGNARHIRSFIEQHFGYDVLFDIGLGFDNITHCDALIATHYSTAPLVKDLSVRTALPAYFVQDYEPYFSPVGTEYFAAAQSYRYGLLCITLGPWLRTMVERHGAEARNISFWVDPSSYYHHAGARPERERPRVIYFARPQMSRRCYDLGLAGLARFAQLRPDVEICLFGAASFPGDIDFAYTSLGILAPDALGELYRTSDVGLAFSTTNPSLVTFEMMACGLPLVDLDVFDSRERHGGYPAELVEPCPDGIAAGLCRLLDNPARREEMRQQSVQFTQSLPTAREALAQVAAIIEDELHVADPEQP